MLQFSDLKRNALQYLRSFDQTFNFDVQRLFVTVRVQNENVRDFCVRGVEAIDRLERTVYGLVPSLGDPRTPAGGAALLLGLAVAGETLPFSPGLSLAAGGAISVLALGSMRPGSRSLCAVAGIVAGVAIGALHAKMPLGGFGLGMGLSVQMLNLACSCPRRVDRMHGLVAKIEADVPARLGPLLGLTPALPPPSQVSLDKSKQTKDAQHAAGGQAERSFLQRVLGVLAACAQAVYVCIRRGLRRVGTTFGRAQKTAGRATQPTARQAAAPFERPFYTGPSRRGCTGS